MEGGGRLEVFEYETAPSFGAGETQQGVIYLPESYDPALSCPVMYLSHGGGDNAASWVNQGALKHIMDHLIAGGRTGPMAVVLMDNEAFHWDNFGKCIPNLTEYLIPGWKAPMLWAESRENGPLPDFLPEVFWLMKSSRHARSGLITSACGAAERELKRFPMEKSTLVFRSILARGGTTTPFLHSDISWKTFFMILE